MKYALALLLALNVTILAAEAPPVTYICMYDLKATPDGTDLDMGSFNAKVKEGGIVVLYTENSALITHQKDGIVYQMAIGPEEDWFDSFVISCKSGDPDSQTELCLISGSVHGSKFDGPDTVLALKVHNIEIGSYKMYTTRNFADILPAGYNRGQFMAATEKLVNRVSKMLRSNDVLLVIEQAKDAILAKRKAYVKLAMEVQEKHNASLAAHEESALGILRNAAVAGQLGNDAGRVNICEYDLLPTADGELVASDTYLLNRQEVAAPLKEGKTVVTYTESSMIVRRQVGKREVQAGSFSNGRGVVRVYDIGDKGATLLLSLEGELQVGTTLDGEEIAAIDVDYCWVAPWSGLDNPPKGMGAEQVKRNAAAFCDRVLRSMDFSARVLEFRRTLQNDGKEKLKGAQERMKTRQESIDKKALELLGK